MNRCGDCVFNGECLAVSEDNPLCEGFRAAVVESIKRGSVLEQAIGVINGERQDQYGSPEDSFHLIAQYWNTYLTKGSRIVTGPLKAGDVAIMMVLFKIAREANQNKRDNIVDAAGYLGIYGDMVEE